MAIKKKVLDLGNGEDTLLLIEDVGADLHISLPEFSSHTNIVISKYDCGAAITWDSHRFETSLCARAFAEALKYAAKKADSIAQEVAAAQIENHRSGVA